MSRIGDFDDDDVTAFAVKSPDLGTAMAQFTNAVYCLLYTSDAADE